MQRGAVLRKSPRRTPQRIDQGGRLLGAEKEGPKGALLPYLDTIAITGGWRELQKSPKFRRKLPKNGVKICILFCCKKPPNRVIIVATKQPQHHD